MNRTTLVALAAAAVLGVAGGTYAASLGLGPGGGDGGSTEDSSEPPPTTPDPTVSSTPPVPQTPAQLLYMDGQEIRDGYTRVPATFDPDRVTALVRIRGGWLVVERAGQREADFRGTVVAADGKRTDLGEFSGVWDVNEDGTRFVAFHGGRYRVTDLASGAATDLDVTAPQGASPSPNAAFAGSAVLTGWKEANGSLAVLRTEPGSGTTEVNPHQLTGWIASPRGLLMIGEFLSDDGRPCLSGGGVAGDHADWWRTCDWRSYGLRPQYSPNGGQLLVVPTETDGFGPGLYGVIDSESGRELHEIDVPDWTRVAEWGDNNEIFVLGAQNGDDVGSVIRRCKLGASCEVERESSRRLVLGVGV